MTTEPDEYERDKAGKFGPGNRGGPGRKPGTKVPSLKSAIVRRIDLSSMLSRRSLSDSLARETFDSGRRSSTDSTVR